MSDLPDSPPSRQRPGCMVRAFLLVLPLGLAFMVPLSLWIYYEKKHRPAPATSQYAVMLRKELNAGDFARYMRILTQDIGERSLARPENLEAATAFIESTLGYDNMGYAVERQVFEVEGKSLVNLIAELPGKSKPGEVVLVLARCDGTDAGGIAAMMCAAHALTGSGHARTIQFAAVVNAGADDEAANGAAWLARHEEEGQKFVRAIIFAEAPPAFIPRQWRQASMTSFATKLRNAETAPLEALRELQSAIEQAADAP